MKGSSNSRDENGLDCEVLGALTEQPSGQELDQMFDNLSDAIASAPKRPMAALPTWGRYGLAALLALALPALLLALHDPQVEFPYSTASHALFFVLYSSLLGLLVASNLRPFYKPSYPQHVILGLCATAVVQVFAFAVWPTTAVSTATSHGVLPCLLSGSLMGLALFVLLRLLDRGQRLGPWLAASAAVLFGNACLQVHCADADVLHRLLGHAGISAVYLAGVGLLQLVGPRTSR